MLTTFDSWRALSMKQPYAWAMLAAGKAGGPLGAGVENREKWSTQCRGWFLLHASATTTTDYYMKSVDAMHERGLVVPHLMRADSVLPRVPPLEVLPHGVIFGMCQLVTILPKNQAIGSLAPSGIDMRWKMDGQYGFVVTDPRPLPHVKARGAHQFWKVDEKTVLALGLPPTPQEVP